MSFDFKERCLKVLVNSNSLNGFRNLSSLNYIHWHEILSVLIYDSNVKRLNNIQTFIREFKVPNLETEVEYKIVLFVCLFGILCLSISIECSFQYPQNYFIINSETIRIVFV